MRILPNIAVLVLLASPALAQTAPSGPSQEAQTFAVAAQAQEMMNLRASLFDMTKQLQASQAQVADLQKQLADCKKSAGEVLK